MTVEQVILNAAREACLQHAASLVHVATAVQHRRPGQKPTSDTEAVAGAAALDRVRGSRGFDRFELPCL